MIKGNERNLLLIHFKKNRFTHLTFIGVHLQGILRGTSCLYIFLLATWSFFNSIINENTVPELEWIQFTFYNDRR